MQPCRRNNRKDQPQSGTDTTRIIQHKTRHKAQYKTQQKGDLIIDFKKITTEDTSEYLQYLKVCPLVPADCYPSYSYGYDAVWPSYRGYAHGLCWQKFCQDGRTVYYPPMGDWDKADWDSAFAKDIAPGTVFRYVPGTLKDLWVQKFGDRFTIRETRNDWDYLYDLETFYKNTKTQRRYCRYFKEKYEYSVEPVTADNLDIVRALNKELAPSLRRDKNEDYEELDNDEKAMEYVLKHFSEIPTLDGILIRVGDNYVSYDLSDVTGDRICSMFGRNDYRYEGVGDIVNEEVCRHHLAKGRRWLNLACDAGVEHLRLTKQRYRPIAMLEKYEMTFVQ